MSFKRALFVTMFMCAMNSTSQAETPQSSTEEVDPLVYVLPEDKNELFELAWEDLLPPGEDEIRAALYQQQLQRMYSTGSFAEGSEGDVAMQVGTHNTVSVLNGHNVKIAGYPVPIEFGTKNKISEFILVPYFGACLHAPPPPPNQTIYVTSDKPIKLKNINEPIWIEGYIATQSAYKDIAEAAYTVKLENFRVYEY